MKCFRDISLNSIHWNPISIARPCKRNCVEDLTNHFCGFSAIIFVWQVDDQASPLEGAPSSKNAATIVPCSQSVSSGGWSTNATTQMQLLWLCIYQGVLSRLMTHISLFQNPRSQVVRSDQSVVELHPPPKQHLLRPNISSYKFISICQQLVEKNMVQ